MFATVKINSQQARSKVAMIIDMENENLQEVSRKTLHTEVISLSYEEGNHGSSGPSMAGKSGHGDLSLPEKAPKDATPKGDAKSFDEPSSGQSQKEDSGVELVPKDVKITGRNQVVPASTGAIGFETSQEARPEKRKEHHIDCSVIWTQIATGKVDSIPSQIILQF